MLEMHRSFFSSNSFRPVHPVTTFFSLFVFSSPPLPESPLNAELQKKEPKHPKKKGQHLNPHPSLNYAYDHKIKRELLLFDDSWF